jgi:hypothetical protein
MFSSKFTLKTLAIFMLVIWLASCSEAKIVSNIIQPKNGYVFEEHGHAKFIKPFMNENHVQAMLELSGLFVPIESPEMEIDEKFQPYKTLRLKSNGTYNTFARVQAYKEQL